MRLAFRVVMSALVILLSDTEVLRFAYACATSYPAQLIYLISAVTILVCVLDA